MLLPYAEPEFSRDDLGLFNMLVPFDHWTRRADKFVDFVELRELLEPLFSEDGRPAIEPVLFLKITLIMYHDNLSDGQVFARTKTDLAYRRFLGLGRGDFLPDVSSLSKFRARLGADGHKDLFHGLLSQARTHGLVKDRLRLKDATHTLADIAIPAGLQLVAQARNKLLNAAAPFDEVRVVGERIHIETIRESTDGSGNEARLIGRVEHLRDILAWVDQLDTPHDADENTTWQALRKAADVARKVLNGHDTPNEPGKIRSVVDPDARRGKHGDFYDGYMTDVTIDADSELFTAIMVLPANGNESFDTITLIEQEQEAHGNDIENVSIDGAGYDGPVIRQLESEDGPHVKVFVPQKETTNGGKFTADEFELTVVTDEDGQDHSQATCPAGEQSQYKQRDEGRHTTSFRFNTNTCHACPLRNACIDPKQKFGRRVKKNDFQPEYDMVRERAQTDEYADVKRDHPKVERRLGELVNRHGGRRARYRGTARVFAQQLMGAMTANMKRMIRLLDADGPLALC